MQRPLWRSLCVPLFSLSFASSASWPPAPVFTVMAAASRRQPPRSFVRSGSPLLDGFCDDFAYLSGTRFSLSPAASNGTVPEGVIAHDGERLFICLEGSREVTSDIRLVVSTARRPADELGPGELSIRARPAQPMTAWREIDGQESERIRLSETENQLVHRSGGSDSGAELAISLHWLGGYARTVHLYLALLDRRGQVALRWPPGGRARHPSTFARVVLGPLYRPSVDAGSAYLDGRGGKLVIPFVEQLEAANQLTIETWVKVLDDDCGTIFGSDRDRAPWLGVCGSLRFRTAGRAGAEPERAAGGSLVPLMVGADFDAGDDDGRLHAYVRELRIWDRVRSREEVAGSALTSLDGPREGLVGVWPLVGTLADLVGGRDAGLFGSAALAGAPGHTGSVWIGADL